MSRGVALLIAVAGIVMPAVGPALAAAPARILAFGDSLTAGFGLASDEAFPVILQAKLARDGVPAAIANGGVSGDTTAGGLALVHLGALADKPDYVLLELGANDMLRGVSIHKVTRDNLDKMLALPLPAHGTKVLLPRHESPRPTGEPSIRRSSTRYIPISRQNTTCRSIRSSSTALHSTRRSTSRTVCIPMSAASTSWSIASPLTSSA